MKTWYRKWLPLPLLLQTRRLGYLPLDLYDRVLGRRDPRLPPRWLRFVGGGDFVAVGERFLHHFRTLAGLRPEEDVLDVGCGVGRIALPLTGYVASRGSYRGFDVVAAGVDWCRREVTPRYPNFRFTTVDVCNPGYNPRGRLAAAAFRFPYDDASFDFAYATSVFTHMRPGDVARYLGEIRRVLRPGGRCLATFFIRSDNPPGPESALDFRHRGGGYWTTDPGCPEAAVAYGEAELRALVRRAGLTVREPLHYGAWSGRPDALEGQDMALLDRP